MAQKKNRVEVGWCLTALESHAAFEQPEKLTLPTDKTKNKRGFLSCPAVRYSLQGVVTIKSPFSLHLKFRKVENAYLITPVYPFTSVAQQRLEGMLRLEPKESWRSESVPAIQLPSPYLFVADEFLEVEQFSPSIVGTTHMNWRVIPGRFNIYGWHRPLNWAIEWDTRCGDLIIKQGEPLYFLRFYNSQAQVVDEIDLVEMQLTDEIKARLASTSGVTGLKRGLVKVMDDAVSKRNAPLVVPKQKD